MQGGKSRLFGGFGLRSVIHVCALAGALASLFMLPASALAAITTTTIDTPTDSTFGTFDQDALPTPVGPNITITGTTDSDDAGNDLIDVLCYYDDDASQNGPLSIATGVALNPGDGSFTVAASGDYPELVGQACRLRAVPTTTTPTGGAEDAFSGPRMFTASTDTTQDGAETVDFSVFAPQTGGSASWGSFGSSQLCSLCQTRLLTGATLLRSPIIWDVGHTVQESVAIPSLGARSGVRVDGINAYAPGQSASLLVNNPNPAFADINESLTLSAGTNALTTSDTEVLRKCSTVSAGTTNSSPLTTCTAWANAGVQLVRSTSQSSGSLFQFTDTWSSTDGAAHTVELYLEVNVAPGAGGAGWKLPGDVAYAAQGAGTETVSTGPNTVYMQTSIGNESAAAPVGALTFYPAPSGLVFDSNSHLWLHYSASVPASGSWVHKASYAIGADDAPLVTQAEGADGIEDNYGTPTASFTAPATNGTTVTVNSVQLQGTATDDTGLTSSTINGTAVTVSGGTFTTTRSLVEGLNTFTLAVSDAAGNTAQATRTVIYDPPDVTAPNPTVSIAAKLKRATALKFGLKPSVTCDEACTLSTKATVSAKVAKQYGLAKNPHAPVQVASGTANGLAATPVVAKATFTSKAKRRLKSAASFKVTIKITATDSSGNARIVTRTVTLRP